MATGDLTVFEDAIGWLNDGTFTDLDTGILTWRIAVLDNTTAPLVTTVSPILATFTEVGTAGTYTAGGSTLAVSWSEPSAGVWMFDSTVNPTWTQNASNDTDATWGLVYADGTLNGKVDPALCFIELGTVDMSAGDLTITFNANGLFRIS